MEALQIGKSSRIYAIDWLRATAMIWMAIAHAGIAFIAGYHFSESPFRWQPGTPVPDIYITRFITHFCAPTFLFASGVSLYLSTAKKIRQQSSPWQIDRQLIIRGVVLIAIELLLFNVLLAGSHGILLQVLYAIGSCFILMTVIRRLPISWMLGVTLVFLVTNELIVDGLLALTAGNRTSVMALALTGGPIATEHGRIIVSYPVLPWLCVMGIGWCFGYFITHKSVEDTTKLLLTVGAVGISLFLLIRGFNSYGNMNLLRDVGASMSWLFISKYPPSLAYVAMEVGVMALLLAGFLHIENSLPLLKVRLMPFAKLGQAALFFYIAQQLVIDAAKNMLSLGTTDQWWAMYVAGIALSGLLLPLCIMYLNLKSRYPNSPLKYV